MLSSGLYSDPVKAIVREYSTNAQDAHKESGITTPFDVWLPTIDEPEFCIRDYGSGMAPSMVEHIFCSYFASTKRLHNLATGNKGLGCKSALSYTRSVGIVSYFDGKCSRYLLQLSDKDIPEIHTVSAPADTDEPSGVKISFGVKGEDIERFSVAASEVYPFFTIKPRIMRSAVDVRTDNYVPLLQGSFDVDGRKVRWECSPDKSSTDLVMGDIAYPFCDSHNMSKQFGDNITAMRGLSLYVENDTFEPLPSREGLQWTNSSHALLKQINNALKESFITEAKNACKSLTSFQTFCKIDSILGCCDRYSIRYTIQSIAENAAIHNNCFDLRHLYTFRKEIVFTVNPVKYTLRRVVDNPSKGLRESERPYADCVQFDNMTHTDTHAMVSLQNTVGDVGGEKKTGYWFLLQDVRGLTRVLSEVPDRTLVIGARGSKQDSKAYLNDMESQLKDVAVAQDAPFIVLRVSELLKVVAQRNGGNGTSAQQRAKKEDKTRIVFKQMTHRGFTEISPNGATHYIVFNSNSGHSISGCPDIDAMKKAFYPNEQMNVVFIHPRQVKYFEGELKDFYSDLKERMTCKYKGDFRTFAFVCKKLRNMFSSSLSKAIDSLSERLCDHGHGQFPSYREIRYPAFKRLTKEFISSVNTPYGCSRYVLYLNIKGEALYLTTDKCINASEAFERLVNKMIDTVGYEFFTELYADYIQELEKELEQLKERHKYLFRSLQEQIDCAMRDIVFSEPYSDGFNIEPLTKQDNVRNICIPNS